jgi:hypothetical protein
VHLFSPPIIIHVNHGLGGEAPTLEVMELFHRKNIINLHAITSIKEQLFHVISTGNR